MSRKVPTPKPVVVSTICSECDLDWSLHSENPTTSECIALLKAELARRPKTTIVSQPQPYVQPTSPWLHPEVQHRTITCNGGELESGKTIGSL